MNLTVSEVWVYPVKSCGGVSVERGVMTSTGFRFDRNWVVVNSKGRFQSQRQSPSMALIHADIVPHALLEQEDLEEGTYPDAALVLSAPGMPDLSVPLLPANPQPPTTDVSVWKWEGQGRDEGEQAAAWLSEYIGKDCRLVRYEGHARQEEESRSAVSDPTRRPIDEAWLPQGMECETAFADGFPYLVVNQASLQDLNAKLPQGEGPMKMNRFRPNIVIQGAPAWAEDGWARLSVGAAVFALPKPCDRCAVPTVDQETGERGDEPRPTLDRLRSGATLGWAEAVPEFKNAVFFGWNAVEERRASDIAVGAPVTVLDGRTSPAVPRPAKPTPQARPPVPPNFAPAPSPAQRAAQEAIEARRDPARMTTLQKMGLMLVLLFARMIIAHLLSKKKE